MHESTSICSTIFSTIARVFYSLQSKKNSETYAFADQINVFFSISFETIHRLVRSYQHLFIICSTIFFRNCTSVIFITIWNIWSKHTRLQVKLTCFFCSRSKMHVMNLYRKFSFKTILNSFVMNFSAKSILDSFVMNFEENLAKIVVEKRDFEKSSLIAYENRLTSLQNWNESTISSRDRQLMIVVDFQNYNRCTAKCIHCYLLVFEWDCKKSFKKHF